VAISLRGGDALSAKEWHGSQQKRQRQYFLHRERSLPDYPMQEIGVPEDTP
jgi:hypothetical protein